MEKRDDSRTIFAYGAETLAKISQLKILIVGMRGVMLCFAYIFAIARL
jgi:hypothetical protein